MLWTTDFGHLEFENLDSFFFLKQTLADYCGGEKKENYRCLFIIIKKAYI